jgi:DegV family protein with EDD domain
MANIKIVTDSAADIPLELAYELGIEIVPLMIRVDDQPHRAGLDISTEQIYALLQEHGPTVTTVAPLPSVFEQTYRNLAIEYDHIFSIHMSSRLGGTFRAATQACAKLPASLTRIEVIDSRSVSMGMGMVVIAAAQAAQDGATPAEVQRLINSMIRHTHVVFFVDTLEYLERGGRLSLNSSVLGSMQRIKPLMLLDDGDIVPYERTRTRAKAIEGLFTFIEDFPRVQDVYILYGTTPDDVDKLLEKIEIIFPRERAQVGQFGPGVAAHLGPGAMGVAVFEGLEEA